MFIKRDLRKVLQIIDTDTPESSLKLGRREAEFGGSSKLLTDPKHASKLSAVKQCSLYGNNLRKLEHWGVLGDNARDLEDLNVRYEV